MRETPNSYLNACLVMVGLRALTVSCNAPILSLRRSSLGRYETLLRLGRKPTHVHIINRTCPLVVCATFSCIRANPSWSILNSRLVGDTMTVTQKNFIVEFGQESRFLFHHTRVTTICHPRRASSSYRLHVHTFVMHALRWKVGPLRVYNTILSEKHERWRAWSP
jgi:hypothetical protein